VVATTRLVVVVEEEEEWVVLVVLGREMVDTLPVRIMLPALVVVVEGVMLVTI
jgi:hypothetical protein